MWVFFGLFLFSSHINCYCFYVNVTCKKLISQVVGYFLTKSWINISLHGLGYPWSIQYRLKEKTWKVVPQIMWSSFPNCSTWWKYLFWVCLILKRRCPYTQNLLWFQMLWCSSSIRYKGFRKLFHVALSFILGFLFYWKCFHNKGHKHRQFVYRTEESRLKNKTLKCKIWKS